MADVFAPNKRSALMRSVRTRGSHPEVEVQKLLSRLKLRFRTNVPVLPGSPDVVLADHAVAIFVNGCFWHGHRRCSRASLPKTNRKFWVAKISSNIKRDQAVAKRLRREGYSVITVWSCQVKHPELLSRKLLRAVSESEHSAKTHARSAA